MPYIIDELVRWHMTLRAFVTWPRGQSGREAMWRSGAPRSPSRPQSGDAHTRCYAQLESSDLITYSLSQPNGAELNSPAESPGRSPHGDRPSFESDKHLGGSTSTRCCATRITPFS